MLRSIIFFFTFAFTVVLQVGTSDAQVPDSLGPTLTFQGYLTTDAGEPMDSTDVGMTFKLYKGTTEIWSESRTIDVAGGVFNVALGQATTLDTIRINQSIDLGIKLDGESFEMTPRTTLRGTAFAFAMRGLYSFLAEDVNSNKAYNMVGGSYNNSVGAEVVGATIGGGGGVQGGVDAPHTISGDFGTIAGGARNSTGLYAATVGGGVTNNAAGRGATIGGGELNVANGFKDVISGGHGNTTSGGEATVGGGGGHVASGGSSTIAGGWADTASTSLATVCGGGKNAAHGYASVIGGGFQNRAVGDSATVSGGSGNTASYYFATVCGGDHNEATAHSSTVGGGLSNEASGVATVVGGGNNNTASGSTSTIPGGYNNLAEGERSFAAGSFAHAQRKGTFVWQDATASVPAHLLAPFRDNMFRARASGGFYLQTTAAPDLGTGASLAPGSGTWAELSSRASKTAFEEIDTRSYLDRVASLKVMEWSYKTEDGVTHVGPMAEDFYAAFAHGPSEKSITTLDGNGVALAAIQGLYELVKELQAENEQMRAAMVRAGIQ